MLDHEVQGTLTGADYWLPALYRAVAWTRHQGNLFQLIAPIGHSGGNVVVLAVMGERALVESFENDLYLLLEQFPVGVLV
jgi:hypothetical protein